jgi:hypothetical protein
VCSHSTINAFPFSRATHVIHAVDVVYEADVRVKHHAWIFSVAKSNSEVLVGLADVPWLPGVVEDCFVVALVKYLCIISTV